MSEKKTIEETLGFIDLLTDEFIEKDGNVTVEFSTMDEKVAPILRHVSKINSRLSDIPNLKGTRWDVFFCDTCNDRHADYPFHVMITKS